MHAVHAIYAMMKFEDILDKANLAFPEDILLLKPEILEARLHERAGIDKNKVNMTLSTLFKSAMASERFSEAIPSGLEESAVESFKILVTIRLVNSFKTIDPSIIEIAKFSNLSRNLVSPGVKFLESFNLVETKHHMRKQLVFPTPLTTLFIDVISGNLQEEHNLIEKIIKEMKQNKPFKENLTFLKNLETAFHLGKLVYNENTINYDIMDELHNRVMELVVEMKESKNGETVKKFEEFLDIIAHIISVRDKAKKVGVRPIILEKTGEGLGRAKVFRVK